MRCGADSTEDFYRIYKTNPISHCLNKKNGTHCMQNKKIMSFGEIVWDVFEDGASLGGAPLNFAYYCGAFGADVRLVSAVGRDRLGRECLSTLAKKGLDASCVQVLDGVPTGRVEVSVDSAGQPSYEICSPAAWDEVEATDEALFFAAKSDAIAFGTLAQRGEKSRKALFSLLRAASKKCLRVLDVNLRQNYYSKDLALRSLEFANVLKLNDSELPVLSEMFGIGGSEEDCARRIFEMFSLSYLILTRGERGYMVISDSAEVSADAVPAEVKDTVGAGDSFTATFVCRILEGAAPEDAAEDAAKMAAFVCSNRGALCL